MGYSIITYSETESYLYWQDRPIAAGTRDQMYSLLLAIVRGRKAQS